MKKLSQLYHQFDQWGEQRWPWFSKNYLLISFAILFIIATIVLAL